VVGGGEEGEPKDDRVKGVWKALVEEKAY